MCGRLTPDEAEAQAKQAGIEPLATCPDPALFDPMQELAWTFTMALAWIAWRTPEAVRKHWPVYCAACLEWRHDELLGWFLVNRRPPILPYLIVWEPEEGERIMTVAEAERSLWRELANGNLSATGYTERFSRSEPIPNHEWGRLWLGNEDFRQDALLFIDGDLEGHIAYRFPSIPSAQVIAKWPQDGVLPEMAVTHKPIAQATVEAYYKDYVNNWPESKQAPSRDYDLAYMKKFLPQITVQRVRGLRRDFAPWEWRRPGRHKSK